MVLQAAAAGWQESERIPRHGKPSAPKRSWKKSMSYNTDTLFSEPKIRLNNYLLYPPWILLSYSCHPKLYSWDQPERNIATYQVKGEKNQELTAYKCFLFVCLFMNLARWEFLGPGHGTSILLCAIMPFVKKGFYYQGSLRNLNSGGSFNGRLQRRNMHRELP